MVESDSDASQEDDNTAEFVVESDDEASTGAEVVGFMGTGKKKKLRLLVPSFHSQKRL